MIQFMCPNGHQLSAPAERAGKPGKCPKCSTAFVVPKTEVQEEPAAEPPAEEAAGDDDNFVFLCPNGHRLNGPSTMKGKAGQCPHCGARFRIPSDDEEEEEEEAAQIPIVTDGAGMPGPAAPNNLVINPVEAQLVDEEAEDGGESSPVTPACGHPLGDMLMRLWDDTHEAHGLELVLKDGTVLSMDYFSHAMSGDEFGIFAADESGAHSISVVAWEDVARFVIRDVQDLPEGVFFEHEDEED